MDSKVRYQEMVEKLKASGCRLTPQRLALVRLLSKTDSHPSARQLHEELKQNLPTTSLATVYKTLNVLKDLGEVTEMGFSDDDNRYDAAKPYPHPHLICVQCRKIIDADAEPASDLARQLAATSGYRIMSHRMEFYCLCPDCQGEDGSNLLSQEDQPNTKTELHG